jgi:hypothetical protein
MNLMDEFGIQTKSYELPDEGEYKLRLKEMELCDLEWQGKTSSRMRWKFETVTSKDCTCIDSQGRPFQIAYTTGLTYTCSQKANLTKLVKGFFGRIIALDEFAELGKKDLIGKEVIGVVENIEKETGSYPSIILFKTVKAEKPKNTKFKEVALQAEEEQEGDDVPFI